jgi:hypothetical protein
MDSPKSKALKQQRSQPSTSFIEEIICFTISLKIFVIQEISFLPSYGKNIEQEVVSVKVKYPAWRFYMVLFYFF